MTDFQSISYKHQNQPVEIEITTKPPGRWQGAERKFKIEINKKNVVIQTPNYSGHGDVLSVSGKDVYKSQALKKIQDSWKKHITKWLINNFKEQIGKPGFFQDIQSLRANMYEEIEYYIPDSYKRPGGLLPGKVRGGGIGQVRLGDGNDVLFDEFFSRELEPGYRPNPNIKKVPFSEDYFIPDHTKDLEGWNFPFRLLTSNYFLQEGKYIEHIHDKRKTTILEYMDEIEKHFEDLKPYRNKKEYTEDISFQILEYINCIVNYLPLLPLSKKWAEYEKWVKDQKKLIQHLNTYISCQL